MPVRSVHVKRVEKMAKEVREKVGYLIENCVGESATRANEMEARTISAVIRDLSRVYEVLCLRRNMPARPMFKLHHQ